MHLVFNLFFFCLFTIFVVGLFRVVCICCIKQVHFCLLLVFFFLIVHACLLAQCDQVNMAAAADNARVYLLTCPKCETDLHSMWFAFNDAADNHGLIGCSGCIDTLASVSGLLRSD